MIDAAVILAGGRGSRLAPWPAPKCLLPVNGVPIIHRLVEHLAPSVGRIVVCTGYRAKDVQAALSDVEFSDAGEDATMGERLLLARSAQVGGAGHVLVCYGDELVDVSVENLAEQHRMVKAEITFAACRQKLPFGVVEQGRVFSDREVLVNVGFALISSSAWDALKPEDGLADWIDRVAVRGGASTYIHLGRRATVNSLTDLEHAEEVWR